MATTSTLNQVVTIGEVKHIVEELLHVRNGSLEISENVKLRITVDQSYDPVIEEKIRSHHILRYIGRAEDGSKLFDPYIMTLEELLQVKKGERNLDDFVEGCSEAVINLLKSFDFLDSDNRPTKGGIDLMRDTIEGLYELYLTGYHHGELTLKNIVICSEEGKLIAKLTRIKGKQKKDYYELGNIVHHLFGRWVGPEGKEKYVLAPEVDEFQNCVWKMGSKTLGLPESEWIALADERETSFYADPRTIFRHPWFWSADLAITFLIQFRILMTQCYKFKGFQVVSTFRSALDIVKTKGWYDKLDAVVKKSKAAQNRTTDETQYLLRLIRNMYCHFDEEEDDVKSTVGAPPDELFEYFRAKYPDMLLGVHRVLQHHFSKIKDVVHFSYSFELYL
ncbi:hypothetical protein MKW94_019208 [Papaver nudicaule]|uniref:KEN domain-containing protein n=1 Tax=Papaver nudicaule TaxID=74823 RepID=A0AA42B597_PAPNU|nr:hypothetical protein [Papaver nudicaule]